MDIYAITPSFDSALLDKIDRFFAEGNRFLQLRDKNADRKKTAAFIEEVLHIKESYRDEDLRLILNSFNNYRLAENDLIRMYALDGSHQSFAAAGHQHTPHEFKGLYNLISCHSKEDLVKAFAYGYDAVTLSPVNYTLSHPENRKVLGHAEFKELCAGSRLPVFALGGLAKGDCEMLSDIPNCCGMAMIRGVFGES